MHHAGREGFAEQGTGEHTGEVFDDCSAQEGSL